MLYPLLQGKDTSELDVTLPTNLFILNQYKSVTWLLKKKTYHIPITSSNKFKKNTHKGCSKIKAWFEFNAICAIKCWNPFIFKITIAQACKVIVFEKIFLKLLLFVVVVVKVTKNDIEMFHNTSHLRNNGTFLFSMYDCNTFYLVWITRRTMANWLRSDRNSWVIMDQLQYFYFGKCFVPKFN